MHAKKPFWHLNSRTCAIVSYYISRWWNMQNNLSRCKQTKKKNACNNVLFQSVLFLLFSWIFHASLTRLLNEFKTVAHSAEIYIVMQVKSIKFWRKHNAKQTRRITMSKFSLQQNMHLMVATVCHLRSLSHTIVFVCSCDDSATTKNNFKMCP